MNKNIAIVLMIFLVPLCVYWGLTRNKANATQTGFASTGAEIIKFSSPMCYECQELDKIFKEIYPEYSNKIGLRKIDVTNKDKLTLQMIKDYNVKLVPTCVFKDKRGNVLRTTEGFIQPKILENYIREQINE